MRQVFVTKDKREIERRILEKMTEMKFESFLRRAGETESTFRTADFADQQYLFELFLNQGGTIVEALRFIKEMHNSYGEGGFI